MKILDVLSEEDKESQYLKIQNPDIPEVEEDRRR